MQIELVKKEMKNQREKCHPLVQNSICKSCYMTSLPCIKEIHLISSENKSTLTNVLEKQDIKVLMSNFWFYGKNLLETLQDDSFWFHSHLRILV